MGTDRMASTSRTCFALLMVLMGLPVMAEQKEELSPAAFCDDPAVVARRSNLPKTLPWPVEFFQPSAVVKGVAEPRPLVDVGPTSIDPAVLAAVLSDAKTKDTLALLVMRRGRVELEYYAPGITDATLLHSYHMHHTVLAALVGAAVASGKIGSAQDPVAKYIAEWRGTEKSAITIEQLLQMRSGLELRLDAHYSKGMFSRDACAYWGSRTKDFIVMNYGLKDKPGTKYEYNYIVPELLGAVLERSTGRSYQDLLSEALWKPLGNGDARVWLNREGGEAHQDAGLFATGRDWLRFGKMLLDNGRVGAREVLPASWLRAMTQPSPTNRNYGYVWLGSPFNPAIRLTDDPRVNYTVRATAPFFADDVIYASGHSGQRVYIVPSADLVLVHFARFDGKFDNAALLNRIGAGLR